MRFRWSALLSVPLATLAGCGSSGAAQRTGQGSDYSQYVFALYDEPRGGATAALQPSFPMNIAVAEVGQLQPSAQLMEALTGEKQLFHRVQPITGISNGDFYTDPYSTHPAPDGNCRPDGANARLALRRLQRLARDMGMDYLLIVGATIDSQAHSTPLSAMNLTIIGAFVVPAERLTTQGQASSALIDLRTDRVVLTTSSSAGDLTQAPAIAEDGAQDHQVRAVRDAVYKQLGERFVEDCRRRAFPNNSTIKSEK
jgi:hypothetical protein